VQVEQKGGTVELPLVGQGCKTNAATHILDPLEPNMHQKDPKMLTKKKHTKRALKKSGSKHEQGEDEYKIPDHALHSHARPHGSVLLRHRSLAQNLQNPSAWRSQAKTEFDGGSS